MAISAFLSSRLDVVGAQPARAAAAARHDGIALRLNQLVAALLLLMLAPLMLLIAAWICWIDGAPVLFSHFRVGQDGRLFRCLKFRTMCRDSEGALQRLLASDPVAGEQWARDQKLQHDPRITSIGHLLRLSSLDELPQLFNVLNGDMVLVGPRPVTPAELARYGAARWHYLSVRPGITGLWQVSGRNNLSYAERVALDRRYVEQKSAWLDLRILVRTLKVVLARDGAL